MINTICGIITGLTATGSLSVYEFEQDIEHARLVQTGNYDRSAGTVFYESNMSIKLIGLAGEDLRKAVNDIFVKHFPDFDGNAMKVTPSRTGKYHSITAQLRFEELEQVHLVYADLAACPLIKTAL